MTMDISADEIERYKSAVGRELAETEVVGPQVAARLAAALDRDAAGATLPPLWHYGLFLSSAPTRMLGPDGHPPRGAFMPPVRLPRRMFAGSDITFLRPLSVGGEVTRSSRIAAVDHRHGKSGHLVFVRVALALSQGGAVCVEEEQTIVYRAAGARTPAVTETPRAALAEGETAEIWTPTSVELFRYSCATFNSHRIHYDRPYAMDEEGYPGLVVHGPLSATRLCDLACRTIGAAPRRFTFRGEAPLFVDQPVRLVARPDGSACTLRAERADGVTAMSATAVF
jgi:3-methylfumaryl-CoA hydratase